MHQDDPHGDYRTATPAPVALESVRITLDLYRSGKSGIAYAKLKSFSEPILAHYHIELGIGFDDDVSADNIYDTTLLLDILETATIFWEYCSLNDATKSLAFNNLKESLLGPDPSNEDMVQFPILVASMEEKWEQLSDGEPVSDLYINSTENAAQLETLAPSENGAMRYGPEKLDIPDAFALFARPILDNDALYEDPESLDDAMTRAQAYWDLAHLADNASDKNLKSIIARFSSADMTSAQIKEEASLMLNRFHELFPER